MRSRIGYSLFDALLIAVSDVLRAYGSPLDDPGHGIQT
jgi:hypothetical protein